MATQVGFQLESSLASKHLTDATYIKGGYLTVANITERNALPVYTETSDGIIVKGSLVYVQSEELFYQYNGTAWADASFGGGSQAYVVSTDDESAFASTNQEITITTSFTDTEGETHNVEDLKVGETIYVEESIYPNRWVADVYSEEPPGPTPIPDANTPGMSNSNGGEIYKATLLRVGKVDQQDLTPYATTAQVTEVISTHNSNTSAHSDIRQAITTVQNSIPNKTSDITNDSGYIISTVNNLTNYYLKTETYTQTEVNQLLAAINALSYVTENSLPEASETYNNKIVLVPASNSENGNIKDEYIALFSARGWYWEKIGSTSFTGSYSDLTGVPTKLSDFTNDSGYITEITSENVTDALGYTPQKKISIEELS